MTAAAATPPGTAEHLEDGARSRAPSFVGVATVVAACAPVLLSVATVLGQEWHASLDQALQVLRIRDVGSRHTPLVGVFSRWGWAHPGPMLFYVLAPFERIGGQEGVLVGAGVVNVVAVSGATVAALRRGGLGLAAAVGGALALLSAGMGPDVLVDPWNPSVAVLPFAAFVLLVWLAATGSHRLLVWAVLAGSFVVQCHVGYLPLVAIPGAFTAGVVAAGAFGGRKPEDERRRMRVTILATACVALVSWVLPLWQQLAHEPGNLAALWRYGRAPVGESVGWREALGVLGVHAQPLGPWITGDDTNAVGLARADGAAWGIGALVLMTVLAAVAHRRRPSQHTVTLALIVVAVAALNLVATARIAGFFAPYLTLPWRVVGALIWLTVAWSVITLTRRTKAASLHPAAGAIGLAAATAMTVMALPVTVPLAPVSTALGALGPRVAAAIDLDERHLLRSVDARTFDAPVTGLLLDLEMRGVEVFAEPGPLASIRYGSWRVATRDEVDAVLTIADLTSIEAGWRPPASSRPIARYDALSPRQRAEARRLERRIRRDMGEDAPAGPLYVNTPYTRGLLVAEGATLGDVEALAALHTLGDGYVVFLEGAGADAEAATLSE